MPHLLSDLSPPRYWEQALALHTPYGSVAVGEGMTPARRSGIDALTLKIS